MIRLVSILLGSSGGVTLYIMVRVAYTGKLGLGNQFMVELVAVVGTD